ncbi:MAG TPA: hypothetical protein PLN31_06450 [Azoarcus taiwanensis]|nr:hypothetical protein [Azoarcus taiwanensis]
MAFDDKTLYRLQKLLSDSSSLLSDEFRIQAQQTYGLDPNSGELTLFDHLAHLSDCERHMQPVPTRRASTKCSRIQRRILYMEVLP